jgi:GNAT superfamily N-acetyltransferase
MERRSVVVRRISHGRDLRTFIRLPFEANAANAKWAAPLNSDEWHRFDTKRNPAMAYCDAAPALAERDGRAVGRIMGIVNRRHNEQVGEAVGRFGYFDCEDDPETALALFAWVEDWARSKGCDRIVGPMGFTDQDPEGLLIDGFEEDPGIETLHGPRYLPGFLEMAGYGKEVDYVTYIVPTEIPERVRSIAERLAGRSGMDLISFAKSSELKAYAPKILALMNDTYRDIYGYVPLDDREIADLINRFIGYLDPRFVKVVEHEGLTIGFAVGMPQVTPGFRKAKGRLYPFGLFHIWRAMKTTRQINMLLGGVRPEWRGKGVDVLMGVAMMNEAHGAGFTRLDSQHVLEMNQPMRAIYENWGGVIYKRHRIYQKSLS